MDSEKLDTLILTSASGLGDLLLQHSEIGDWCDVVDKQIDAVGYEVTESKKTSSVSSAVSRAEQPLYFAPPFYAYVSNVSFQAARSDIYYFFGGYEKVSNVHMCTNASAFNGSCLIELKNFTSFIDALKLDEQEVLGRMIGVEHLIHEKRRKYSMQQLENAREDIDNRRRDGRHSYSQSHQPFPDGPRDGDRRRIRPPNYSNNAQSSHCADGSLRTGGQMVSNDVRATQVHQPHGSQTNIATNFQRGLRSQHYQKSQPRYPPQQHQQQNIFPSRNNLRADERPEHQPLLDSYPPRSVLHRPAHSDIYGLGKPADTSNKLLEIQEKLDKERMTASAMHAFHDNADMAAPPPPPLHSLGGGGRHNDRPTHSSETGHSKHSRPSVSQSGLDAIKKIVVASNSIESNRSGVVERSGDGGPPTTADSVLINDASSVNGGCGVRKSFSRDSQKSGSGGGRRSGPPKGAGGSKIYFNSGSRKSLSHQSSVGGGEHPPVERKPSNNQMSTAKFERSDYNNDEQPSSQQSRTSQHKITRSETVGERHYDSRGRKSSFGNSRPPRPAKSDERNSRKRIDNKTPGSESNVSVTGSTMNKQANFASEPNHNNNRGNGDSAPVKHVQKPMRASSAGEPATEKTTRQSSVEIVRPTSEATVTEAKSDAVSASAKTKNKKKQKRQDSVQAYSKTNRFAALPVGDSH